MAGMQRRRLLAAMLGAAIPAAARAQQAPSRLPRIGMVFNTAPLPTVSGDAPSQPVMREFLLGLRELGYVEGRDVVIVRRSAEGDLDRLEAMVAELATLPVDVIVVSGNVATLAAKRATTQVPVVSAGMHDPVRAGIAQSYARPGGNITGLVPAFGNEPGMKRLELLHELVPKARRVALFMTPMELPSSAVPVEVASAARSLGIALVQVDAQLPRIDAGLAQVERESPDALIVVPTAPIYPHLQRVVEFADAKRIPDVHGYREAVELGALASYGIDSYDAWRRVAGYVHRILHGAKPGELPIEKHDRYQLVLNERRARALRLTIPKALYHRADQVIA